MATYTIGDFKKMYRVPFDVCRDMLTSRGINPVEYRPSKTNPTAKVPLYGEYAHDVLKAYRADVDARYKRVYKHPTPTPTPVLTPEAALTAAVNTDEHTAPAAPYRLRMLDAAKLLAYTEQHYAATKLEDADFAKMATSVLGFPVTPTLVSSRRRALGLRANSDIIAEERALARKKNKKETTLPAPTDDTTLAALNRIEAVLVEILNIWKK